MYQDDYPTCAETYATLRLYPGDIDPDIVTERLSVAPTTVQRPRADQQPGHAVHPAAWFLTSEGVVESRDVRRHIDWVLERVVPAGVALRELVHAGVRADIFCYWRSAGGHGGPCISPEQARVLAELELDCSFDIY